MKKYLFIIVAAMLLVGCGKKQAVETTIARTNVELMGDLFSSFNVSGDAHLLMVPNPDNKSKWMIRATVPLQKTDSRTIRTMSAAINLLDGNGTKIDEGFMLFAEDINSVLPVLNSTNTEKTLVFSAPNGLKKDFSCKEASKLIEKVKKFGLTLSASKINPPVNASEQNETISNIVETPVVDESMTLDDLLKQYDIYNKLAKYDYYLRNGQKKKAKQLEDQMWAIENQVKNDRSLPKRLRDSFMDYVERREDQIEDKY